MSPFDTVDLSTIIEKEGNEFVVFKSPDSAEDKPAYKLLGKFPTETLAQDFVAKTYLD